MNNRIRIALILLSAAFAAPPLSADTSLVPILDKSFDFLDGGSSTLRDQLAGAGTLVLVVWNTECPVCLVNVAQVDALDTDRIDARLLGVNFDASRYDALDAVRDRDLSIPQLHDPDGHVAEAVGSLGESFAFVVLDGEGNLLEQQIGSVPDAAVELRRALLDATREGSPAPAPWRVGRKREASVPEVASSSGRSFDLRIRGNSRIRLLGIGTAQSSAMDTCGCGLTGPYGEALHSVKDLLFRVTVEPELRYDGGVRAGARLRLGNEDTRFLGSGPQYLSDERGSVFAEIRRGETVLRLGYDDWHFTPLTLQRWDFADNPPAAGSGGSGGCGVCGGAVRSVSLEALDRLGPDVTIEGAHLRSAPREWLRLTAHYGRVARPASWSALDPDAFSWRRDLFSARATLSRRFPAGRATLGGNYVAVRDDAASSEWVGSALDPNGFLYRNEVYSGDLALELSAGILLTGEVAHSNRREDRVDLRRTSESDWAGLVELSRELPGASRLAVAWLRLGEDYEAAFSALTYQANLEGVRASLELTRSEKRLGIFVKSLSRVEDGGEAPESRNVFGGLVGLQPVGGMQLELAVTHTREERADDCECGLSSFSLSGVVPFGGDARLRGELNKVIGERVGTGDPGKGDIGILEIEIDI